MKIKCEYKNETKMALIVPGVPSPTIANPKRNIYRKISPKTVIFPLFHY